MLDVVSVALRAVSFVLLLQAAGAALFAVAFGRSLRGSFHRWGRAAALAALVAVVGHYALEPARMAGELSGVFDASLQSMVWSSSSAAAFALRLLGLALIVVGLGRASGRFAGIGVAGAGLVVVSFTLTGHTATHAHRWLLAPLLLIHLLIVALWFGALWPLYLVSLRESRERAGRLIDAFSATAVWLVPLILLAGVAIAAILLPDLAALAHPYGELLVTKVVLFAALMGFAALNKWRFGPAIAGGDAGASTGFRRSVLAEYVLVCAVLVVTAVMTAFFSPE
jgi:copper resistance protein D